MVLICVKFLNWFYFVNNKKWIHLLILSVSENPLPFQRNIMLIYSGFAQFYAHVIKSECVDIEQQKKHINSTEWCYWKISNYRFFCLAALKGFDPHFWCCRFNFRTNCRLKMKQQQQMSMVHLQIQAIINSNQLCHSSNELVWYNAPVFFLSLLFPLQTSFI